MQAGCSRTYPARGSPSANQWSLPVTLSSFIRKSHLIAMSAATAGLLALPVIAAADDSGQARPSLHSDVTTTTTRGACAAEKQAFVSSAADYSTTSNTLVNLVGPTLNPTITQGCLVVDFTAETDAPNNNVLLMKILLDGTPMASGQVQLSGADLSWATSHGFSFVATGLSSGPHRIQVQFSNLDGTNPVHIFIYTLVAHYD